MALTQIDGDIATMTGMVPNISFDGKIFRTRDDLFVFDKTVYGGPLYKPATGPLEVPRFVGYAPDSSPNGAAGVWKWVNPPRALTDAERIYGVSPNALPEQNAERLQRCIDEALILGQYHILLPSGEIEVDQKIFFHLRTALNETITCGGQTIDPGSQEFARCGGKIILQGQQRTTLKSTVTNDNCFVMGFGSQLQPNGEPYHGVNQIVLRDLTFTGAHSAGFEDKWVLRLAYIQGGNELDRVAVNQHGVGNGLEIQDVWLSRLHMVAVNRFAPESTEQPWSKRSFEEANVSDVYDYQGTGLWIHNELYDGGTVNLQWILIAGSFFDPQRWERGLVLGENGTSAAIANVCGNNIDVEACNEGCVIGSRTRSIDFSGFYAERNGRVGVRIYNGAKDVAIRSFYGIHKPGTPIMEGEIVLGKEGGTSGENSYEGIVLDGVHPRFIYNPVVRVVSGGDGQDITIRNVRGGELQTPTTVPLTDSVIKLDDAAYHGLVIENIRQHDQPPGVSIPRVNFPRRVERLVYSRVSTISWSKGHEERRKPAALAEVFHKLSQGAQASPWVIDVDPDSPYNHRVEASSTIPTIFTLPEAAQR